MKKNQIKSIIILTLLYLLGSSSLLYAHSGRTDSSGGHKDRNNVSGLGSYHYHHGEGPHLHTNGICPYDTTAVAPVTNTPKKSVSPTNVQEKSNVMKKASDAGYADGYQQIANKSSSYSGNLQSDYVSAYNASYEKGKNTITSEIDQSKQNGINDGIQNINNSKTYTNSSLSSAYLVGYTEGIKKFIANKRQDYIALGTSDSKELKDITLLDRNNLPSELITVYQSAYQEEEQKQKDIYLAMGEDSVMKKTTLLPPQNQKALAWVKEGIAYGNTALQNEKNAYYQMGYTKKSFTVQEEHTPIKDELLIAYTSGNSDRKIADKKMFTSIAICILIVGILGATVWFIVRKKKLLTNK